MKYYFVRAETMYGECEFWCTFVWKQKKETTQEEMNKWAEKVSVHIDSGEELKSCSYKEITPALAKTLEKLGLNIMDEDCFDDEDDDE